MSWKRSQTLFCAEYINPSVPLFFNFRRLFILNIVYISFSKFKKFSIHRFNVHFHRIHLYFPRRPIYRYFHLIGVPIERQHASIPQKKPSHTHTHAHQFSYIYNTIITSINADTTFSRTSGLNISINLYIFVYPSLNSTREVFAFYFSIQIFPYSNVLRDSCRFRLVHIAAHLVKTFLSMTKDLKLPFFSLSTTQITAMLEYSRIHRNVSKISLMKFFSWISKVF